MCHRGRNEGGVCKGVEETVWKGREKTRAILQRKEDRREDRREENGGGFAGTVSNYILRVCTGLDIRDISTRRRLPVQVYRGSIYVTFLHDVVYLYRCTGARYTRHFYTTSSTCTGVQRLDIRDISTRRRLPVQVYRGSIYATFYTTYSTCTGVQGLDIRDISTRRRLPVQRLDIRDISTRRRLPVQVYRGSIYATFLHDVVYLYRCT